VDESGNYPFVCRMLCRMQKHGPITGRAKRHIEKLVKAAAEEGLLYVGQVETEERLRLFFYAAAPDALETLEALYAKEKLLRCRADIQEDPQWDFYRGFLYPDAAKHQTEENRKQIARIEKTGDNLAAARRLRLHMFFPAETLSVMFAEQSRKAGFALGDTEFLPELECPHGQIIIAVSTLEKPAMDALTTRAIRLAAPYEGKLMYWDCPMIPKASPFR